VHGNRRFSEDIDLDNFSLSWEEFGELIQKVKLSLELEGFLVETSMVAKGAYHCDLRFPELLYEQGLSPHQHEKILIQLDTIAQGYTYTPEIKILNKFDVFTEIRVTPLNVLLSQKIYTAINRKRPKGRDFYDITFLFSKTKPDFGYINQKMGLTSPEMLREELLQKIKNFDFDALAVDVAPFLITKEQVNRVVKFREFWKQVEMVGVYL
jgi:predicted nucleotidyltransferase component of viral defense system